MKTTLPQDPKANKADRKKELAEKQKDYRWSTAVSETPAKGTTRSNRSSIKPVPRVEDISPLLHSRVI